MVGILPDGGALLLNTFLLFTFTEMGFSPWLITAIFVLDGILEMIIDPIVGRVSDRTKSRLGRRRPFIWGAAIVAPLALFGNFSGWLWTVPIWTLVWSFAATPYNALARALTEDPSEQVDLIVWRSVATRVGQILTIFSFPLLGARIGYNWAALLMGIAIALPALAAPREKWIPTANTGSRVWSPIKDPVFRQFIGRMLPGNIVLAGIIPAVPFLYGKENAGYVLAGVIVLIAVLSPVAGRLSKRFGPPRVLSWVTWGWAALVPTAIFIPDNILLVGIPFAALSAVGATGVLICTLEHLTAIQRFSEEGTYAGAYKFFTKMIDNVAIAYLAHIVG